MSNVVARDGSLRLRLIPPGKNRLPWFASSQKYPWIGYPVFWSDMTEAERDSLYAVYQEEGLGALHDAVRFLDKNVWPARSLKREQASSDRGREMMEGR